MPSPRGDGIFHFLILLIIVVEEHGLDLDDLVVLLLLHLNVGVDLLEAVLYRCKGLGRVTARPS